MVQVQLSDGKKIRALPGSINQVGMFSLSKKGYFDPKEENIATIGQLDDAINKAKNYFLIPITKLWARTEDFVFYPNVFEKNGLSSFNGKDKLVWVDIERNNPKIQTDRMLIATLNLSGLQDGLETISKANKKMIPIVPISKLALEKTEDTEKLIAYNISVVSDFDPLTDIIFKNVSVNAWSNQIDEDGYPLNTGKISPKDGMKDENARLFSVWRPQDFVNIIDKLPEDAKGILKKMKIENDLGYVGSVFHGFEGFTGRQIVAGFTWPYITGVMFVERSATTQLVNQIQKDTPLVEQAKQLNDELTTVIIKIMRTYPLMEGKPLVPIGGGELSVPIIMSGTTSELMDPIYRASILLKELAEQIELIHGPQIAIPPK